MVRTAHTIYEDTDSIHADCGMIACGELAVTSDREYLKHKATHGFGVEYNCKDGHDPDNYKVLVVYSRDLALWEL